MGPKRNRLQRSFFQRPPPVVARALLGTVLVRKVGKKRLSGMVVETEAYGGPRDPASHAYRGMTPRNRVMFGEAGHAYVYFTMGLHFCLNVTTGSPGSPGAVLLRALEPVEGLGQMLENRGTNDESRVVRGPGNLTKALLIDRAFNGEDIIRSKALFFEEGVKPPRVGVSARIGVTSAKTRPWRFFVTGNLSVSRIRSPSRIPITHN
jgi:DNA-3-methyladenine glycosylase